MNKHGAGNQTNYIVLLVVILAGIIALGVVGKARDWLVLLNPADRQKVKTVFETERKAAEEGRFLNQGEVDKMSGSLRDLARSADPESAKQLREMTSLLEEYRATAGSFVKKGGADLKTMKDAADLDERIRLLQKCSTALDRINELGKKSDKTTAIEIEILHKVQFQLNFYRQHWGQWQFGSQGEPLFRVTQADLDLYNGSVRDIQALKAKELESMKETANKNLDKLKAFP